MLVVLAAIIYIPLLCLMTVYQILFPEPSSNYIDKRGKPVEPEQTDKIICAACAALDAELVLSYEGGRYGFRDKTGKLVIPHRFQHAFPFSDGLAFVIFPRGQRAFINRRGKIALRVTGEIEVDDFHQGVAYITRKRRVFCTL